MVLVLTACSSSVEISHDSGTLHPFVGCWQSADGSGTESWTEDPSGWLFGYAVNRDEDGKVTFFEQMRIADGVLTVIGPNDDLTEFTRVKAGPEYIFENPEHDFPQRIAYTPSKGRLDAYISAMDGSNKIEFKKQACN